ncbi:MAG: hypothetical protein VB144_07670 [Clostridia bacterium]|nr:hypothetical protein [Clostridia bacterium]
MTNGEAMRYEFAYEILEPEKAFSFDAAITADDEGQGIEGVSLHFGGRRSFGTAATGPDGTWSKDGTRGTVTVTAARPGWTFDPASRQVTGPGANVSFVGSRQLTVTPRALQMSTGPSKCTACQESSLL